MTVTVVGVTVDVEIAMIISDKEAGITIMSPLRLRGLRNKEEANGQKMVVVAPHTIPMMGDEVDSQTHLLNQITAVQITKIIVTRDITIKILIIVRMSTVVTDNNNNPAVIPSTLTRRQNSCHHQWIR